MKIFITFEDAALIVMKIFITFIMMTVSSLQYSINAITEAAIFPQQWPS